MGKWRYKKKSKMCPCRKRDKIKYNDTDKMNFSYEELYSMYGQYDTFVSLEFHNGSESHQKYGQSLMGTFKYTLEQRAKLEEILKLKKIPRSKNRITFEPSILHEQLTEEQKIDLDKIGILNEDICCVSSMNKPRQNVFSQKGNKELPKPLEIKIDWSIKDTYATMLGLYKTKLKNGIKLTEIEKNDYFALRLYFEPETISEEEKKFIYDEHTKEARTAIREKFLNVKWDIEGGLPTPEDEEYTKVMQSRWANNMNILKKEIQRSGNKLESLPIDMQMRLMTLSCLFKDEILLMWNKPIWWDIERFLHIYIRHIAELQPDGNFKNKTVFQYKFEDIRKLVCAVIDSVSKDIDDEFKANPAKSFKRQGKRAVYYNGNYYKVEIEPSGRLVTFHPYNDDKEREDDDKLQIK